MAQALYALRALGDNFKGGCMVVENVRFSGIEILPEAWQRLKQYVSQCPYEISGFGKVVKTAPGSLLITSVFLLHQEVGPSSTIMNSSAIMDAMQEEAMNGRSTEDWCLWWHSHVNFEPAFSSVDLATIETFNSGYLISLCINKLFKYCCRLDVYEPVRISLRGGILSVRETLDPSLPEDVTNDIKNKVTYRAPKTDWGSLANDDLEPGAVCPKVVLD
jgi:proteasome lid subunit RPN8/RPN11